MDLENSGFNSIKPHVENLSNVDNFELGRLIAGHKERCMFGTQKGKVEAAITGNMRYSAKNREEFPDVADWVTLISCDPEFENYYN